VYPLWCRLTKTALEALLFGSAQVIMPERRPPKGEEADGGLLEKKHQTSFEKK
jgi:hypothetical protein